MLTDKLIYPRSYKIEQLPIADGRVARSILEWSTKEVGRGVAKDKHGVVIQTSICE